MIDPREILYTKTIRESFTNRQQLSPAHINLKTFITLKALSVFICINRTVFSDKRY